MALINIYYECKDEESSLTEIKELLINNNLKLETIMASNQELQTAVTELQASVDAEQVQISELLTVNAQVVTDLTAANASLAATITELEAQIAAGSTPAQIQATIDQLSAVKADLESTVEAATPTV